jgi:hypothetical protein
MAARSPSGQLQAPAVAAGSAGSISLPAVSASPPGPTLEQPAAGGSGVWIALAVAAALALIGGGGAAFYFFNRAEPTPVKPVDPPPRVDPVVKPVVKVDPPRAPDPPPKEEVLVDTVPTGARILENGRSVADTPEVLKVSRGATMEVTLHKDGYVDKAVTLDPAREHKVIVRLEKIEKEHHTSHSSKPTHEAKPPVVVPIAQPHPPPPPPKKQPGASSGPINPYE